MPALYYSLNTNIIDPGQNQIFEALSIDQHLDQGDYQKEELNILLYQSDIIEAESSFNDWSDQETATTVKQIMKFEAILKAHKSRIINWSDDCISKGHMKG